MLKTTFRQVVRIDDNLQYSSPPLSASRVLRSDPRTEAKMIKTSQRQAFHRIGSGFCSLKKAKWMARVLIAVPGLFVLAIIVLVPASASAQRKCGAEGHRPCKVWERIPSCNKGLYEDFKLNMCVGSHTQVDARTGKYIPRRTMTTLKLCNRSSRPVIYAAFAQWVDDEDGWVSRGWFQIPAGRCDTADLDYEYAGSVYIYGSSEDGTEWDSNDANFCVKTRGAVRYRQ